MATFNPDLVLTTTIGRRTGGVEPTTISARLGDFPQEAIDKIVAYGFQRVFNDAVGGKDTPHDDKVKAVRAMIERFKRGEVGRTRGEAVDPFMTIVLRIVRARVKAKNPEAYKKLSAEKDADKRFMDVFNAAKPDVQEAIKAAATEERKMQEAKAKRLASIDVDTSDLL